MYFFKSQVQVLLTLRFIFENLMSCICDNNMYMGNTWHDHTKATIRESNAGRLISNIVVVTSD